VCSASWFLLYQTEFPRVAGNMYGLVMLGPCVKRFVTSLDWPPVGDNSDIGFCCQDYTLHSHEEDVDG
jgi:hypothetical protein